MFFKEIQMGIYTTEITSSVIPSDNPLHQRLLKPYYLVKDDISGHVLEVGCGDGRGIDVISNLCESYTGIDKNGLVLDKLKKKFTDSRFIKQDIPPLKDIASDRYSIVLSFQVIEHIRDDVQFLKELKRVIMPGGKVFITTPNIKKSLTRNPWHIREYTSKQLEELVNSVFDKVTIKGITGNDKVWQYYEMNKKSVEKITRFDVFNLQYKLPRSLLRIPYDILNRINRNRLNTADNSLTSEISHEDYLLTEDTSEALDFFVVAEKK